MEELRFSMSRNSRNRYLVLKVGSGRRKRDDEDFHSVSHAGRQSESGDSRETLGRQQVGREPLMGNLGRAEWRYSGGRV